MCPDGPLSGATQNVTPIVQHRDVDSNHAANMTRYPAKKSAPSIDSELAYVSEAFPEPLHLRRLLAVGGRWTDTSAGGRALVLVPGASLLIQSRRGIMVEFVREDRYSIEIAENAIERFARALDVIESRGSILTDGCVSATHILARMRRIPVPIHISYEPCVALIAPTEAAQQLGARILNWSKAPDADSPVLGEQMKSALNAMQQVLESFSLGLDQEALSLCRQLNTPSVQLYAYLQESGSVAIRRSRQEVVRMFPFLAQDLASRDHQDFASIRMAIDLGESPIQAICLTYGISKDVVGTVAHRTALELGIEDEENESIDRDDHGPWGASDFGFRPGQMFGALAIVPAGQRPGSRAQWRLFQRVANGVAEDLGQTRGMSIWALYIGRHVLRSLARMGWPMTIAIGQRDIDIELALDDLIHFLNAAFDALQSATNIDPLQRPCPGFNPYDEIGEFASRRGLRTLLSMSGQWHDLYSSAIKPGGQTTNDETGAQEAIALLSVPIQVDALTFVQLRTQSDFLRESAELRHCVASQYTHALAGDAAYFSVRNAEGRRFSTFDLSIRRHNGSIKVILNHHRGFRNRRPAEEVRIAVKGFCDRLLEEPLKEATIRYVERVEGWRRIQGSSADAMGSAQKADQEARALAASEVLRRFLPGMVRNLWRKYEQGD